MKRQGRLLGCLVHLLPLLLVLTACGSGRPGWSSFPIPIYSDASFQQSAQLQTDFEDSIRFWEERAGKKLFDYQGVWTGSSPYQGSLENPDRINANVIFFQNPWPFAQTIVGQTITRFSNTTIEGGMVVINPNTFFCSGDCQGMGNRVSQRKVIAHELGHFLGLPHIEDKENIMYPEALPGGTIEGLKIDDVHFRELTAN